MHPWRYTLCIGSELIYLHAQLEGHISTAGGKHPLCAVDEQNEAVLGAGLEGGDKTPDSNNQSARHNILVSTGTYTASYLPSVLKEEVLNCKFVLLPRCIVLNKLHHSSCRALLNLPSTQQPLHLHCPPLARRPTRYPTSIPRLQSSWPCRAETSNFSHSSTRSSYSSTRNRAHVCHNVMIFRTRPHTFPIPLSFLKLVTEVK